MRLSAAAAVSSSLVLTHATNLPVVNTLMLLASLFCYNTVITRAGLVMKIVVLHLVTEAVRHHLSKPCTHRFWIMLIGMTGAAVSVSVSVPRSVCAGCKEAWLCMPSQGLNAVCQPHPLLHKHHHHPQLTAHIHSSGNGT